MVEIQVFMIFRSATKEYLPITGMAEFNKLSAQLVFGADSYEREQSDYSPMLGWLWFTEDWS